MENTLPVIIVEAEISPAKQTSKNIQETGLNINTLI